MLSRYFPKPKENMLLRVRCESKTELDILNILKTELNNNFEQLIAQKTALSQQIRK